jgi:hypothetical protein
MAKIFAKGMNVTRNDNAPDFILCKLGIRCKDFFEFMKEHEDKGWVNIEIKESKDGKLYAELDTWKPNQEDRRPQDDDDYPF